MTANDELCKEVELIKERADLRVSDLMTRRNHIGFETSMDLVAG